MKTQKLAALLATVVMIAPTIGQETEEKPKSAISNTRTASCLVNVTCDRPIFPLEADTLERLVRSSGAAGKAARQVLGSSHDEIQEFLSVEFLHGGPGPQAVQPWEAQSKYRPQNKFQLEDEEDEEAQFFEMMRARAEKSGPKYARARRPGAEPRPAVPRQSIVFRLGVDLDAGTKPAAEEFMNALINNLRQTLLAAYDAYDQKVDQEFRDATAHREWARDRLSVALGLTGNTQADSLAREQLENGVDLSSWSPEMPFGDAIDVLKNSHDQPVRIAVLWHDSRKNAGIDQTTAIGMDPLPRIQVGKALDLLLKSVASGTAELGYEIDRGVITIATVDSLPSAQRRLLRLEQTNLPVEVLLERKKELIRQIQHDELNIAIRQRQRLAIEERISALQHQVDEKLKDDAVTKELENLIRQHEVHLENLKSLHKAGRLGETDIAHLEEKLAQAKVQLAERRDIVSQQAGAAKIANYGDSLAQSAVELAAQEAGMEVRQKHLNETENQLKAASSVDPEISQIRLAQEELEIAERRLTELRIRRASLREPTVTVLGGI